MGKALKNNKCLALVLTEVVLFIAILFCLVSNSQLKTLEGTQLQTDAYPKGWKLSVEDNTRCHKVEVWSSGKYDDTIENYVKKRIFANTSQPILKIESPFGITNPNLFDIDTLEPGTTHVMYFKSPSDNVYHLVVFDDKQPSPIEPTGCYDLEPMMQSLISTLP